MVNIKKHLLVLDDGTQLPFQAIRPTASYLTDKKVVNPLKSKSLHH
jgi:hypothetical protein